ncbi:anion transporter [Rhodocaloribacter litoris]|uniref:anion transporter n=1 Tax=Rhodocaloribacter litoris TaxID=2558931 RepID=UPI0014215202|nr:anion transporter [Rhodocaloribacter litoris]QXD16392.1 anion transporter [Rhodocaloribacter litoris]
MPPPWLSLLVIALTFAGIAAGHVPGLRMNRASIALVGAAALLALGLLSLEEAYAVLDLDTLTLLFGMMVLNANLRMAGFFSLVAGRLLHRTRSPRQLLFLLMIAAGLLSALFLNDTIVLIFTPLVAEVTLSLRRNPIPYLMGLALAANIGSVATITGNPQNMLIGVASGLRYTTFSAYLLPVALIGLVLAWIVVVRTYRSEFGQPFEKDAPPATLRYHRPLLRKSLLATGLLLGALLAGVSPPLAALTSAALLLVTRRLKPERVFREIDWSLLVFFAGLFVVTGALETTGWRDRLFTVMLPLAEGGVVPLSLVSATLSNLISNVPAVMLFRPFVPQFPDPTQAWLTLAMATTLAGNLTLLGSVANLIVAETARHRGIRLTFTEYLRAGLPTTFLTLGAGMVWLLLVT